LQTGIYVGKILKGAQPADLPILQPTKIEFVLNLKSREGAWPTPDKLIALADEAIE
jgi:putative tryptophan/tyrosine transport system substrate-binding protein